MSASRAISLDPTGDFDGIDGAWNTFPLHLGSPPQNVKVLIATSSQETWAITSDACAASDTTCRSGRGNLFNISASRTWENKGAFALSDQGNLGYSGTGHYGFDTVSTGWNGSQGVNVSHSVIAGTSSEDFHIGLMGLSPRPTNFTDGAYQHPSFLTLLKESGQISSLSYGYTAGAKYQGAGRPASLTLGGYDSARLIRNNISWPFDPTTHRDLLVNLDFISATALIPTSDLLSTTSTTMLFNGRMKAFVDGGTPHIWLPADACSKFSDYFGLKYDEATDLYTVDGPQHEKLVAQKASITFGLSPPSSAPGAVSVDIILPYAAFDVEAIPPYRNITAPKRYFPLRRAANESQFTLGRAFLQEAYLLVDYERRNFSISQASNITAPKEIVPISPPLLPQNNSDVPKEAAPRPPSNSTPGPTPSGEKDLRPILGGAIGGAVALLFLIIALTWILKARRSRRRQNPHSPSDTNDINTTTATASQVPYAKPELDATTTEITEIDSAVTGIRELEGSRGGGEEQARCSIWGTSELEGDCVHPAELNSTEGPMELESG